MAGQFLGAARRASWLRSGCAKQRGNGRRLLRFEVLEDRRVLATLPSGFTETVVASNLTSPITMDIEESGRIWLAFQDGRIEVIENDALLPAPAIQLDADGSGERGLQGIELDPDFANNGYIYVYYTAAHNQAQQLASHNRLSRLSVDPTTQNTIAPGSEVILLELPEFSTLPTNQNPIWHMGGAIHFLPDGTLAVQVGDHLNNSIVQNNNSPLGKVLRVNKDGTPVTDNPFYSPADTNPPGGNDWNGNAPGDIDWIDYVWASGLRNPFSGDVDPASGRYFVNDVGEGTWEEIDEATVAGRNFGWPTTEGNFNQATYPNFTLPFYAYNHSADCAITGGAFYSTGLPQFPAEYEGMYFFSQFCAGSILAVDPADSSDVQVFASGIAYPMNIEFAADGSMYFVERGAGAGGDPGVGTGRIVKVQYAAEIAPQIVLQPSDRLVSVGDDATFTVSAAGTPPLSYQWQRYNGSSFVDIPGATSTDLLVENVSPADDDAQFRVVVTNSFGSDVSNVATLDVTTDTPPTAQIDLPADGTSYRAGDTIVFSGLASDLEDGTLGAGSMTWQIDFHHDTHLHPFLPPTSGITGGQFTVPTNSETSPNVWFRIHLSVTDSAGLTTEATRDIHPVTSDFAVEANVDGATILVDGQPKQTPTTITGVVGVRRSLEAMPVVNIGGKIGHFVQWMDGETELLREIATPEDDTAYVALYESIPSSMVFLSDLVPVNDPPPNGWGPIEYDTSNGEQAGGDGNPMAVGGVRYVKGLGVHAASDVRYTLGGAYGRFIADVGVDDETGNGGSVVFQVYGDNLPLYQSSTRTGGGAAGQRLHIDVDVTGVQELKLVVTDAGDGNGLDHADWGNARLIAADAGSNTYVNFQPSGTPPAGYVVDSGLVFGDRGGGLQYGWSTVHTAVDRNVADIEELLETSVLLQAAQKWEIVLANGSCAVTVSVGDAGAGNSTTNTVNVEGVSYWNALSLAGNEFGQRTQIIQVADGRLTIDAGSSSTTRINFVEIIPLPPPGMDSGLFPFFEADVNLDGKLTLADVLDFGAGWGNHDPGLAVEQRVRLGDIDFDGDTDQQDWDIFHGRWIEEHGTLLLLEAVLNPIAGDFSRNGTVDSVDYAVWRSTFGSTDELAADGNGNGMVDAADYVVWRKNLGTSIGVPSANDMVVIIDLETGLAALKNDTSSTVIFDGYSIRSADGALQPGNGFWNSLQDQSIPGWQEAAPTNYALSELNPTGSLSLGPGQQLSIGDVLDTALPATGITFRFNVPGDSATHVGTVLFGPLGGAPASANGGADAVSAAVRSSRSSTGDGVPVTTSPADWSRANLAVTFSSSPVEVVGMARIGRSPIGSHRHPATMGRANRADANWLNLLANDPNSRIDDKSRGGFMACDAAFAELASDKAISARGADTIERETSAAALTIINSIPGPVRRIGFAGLRSRIS